MSTYVPEPLIPADMDLPADSKRVWFSNPLSRLWSQHAQASTLAALLQSPRLVYLSGEG